LGQDRVMRRTSIALAVGAAAVAVAAPGASAKSTCSAPDHPAWHSCLTARHLALPGGNVQLTRATPTLVLRLAGPCPAHLAKRTVVLRTKKGKRLARTKVAGHCRGDIARFRVNIRPDLELPPRTVVQSYWSGIADSKVAPKVKLR
jgi:hypothetical protein